MPAGGGTRGGTGPRAATSAKPSLGSAAPHDEARDDQAARKAVATPRERAGRVIPVAPVQPGASRPKRVPQDADAGGRAAGRECPAGANADLQIASLLRRLVDFTRSAESPGGGSTDAGGHDVLMDVEMDGVRYRLLQSKVRPPPAGPCAAPLSPREREISRMVASGYPNKTIAAVLEISAWTVNTYLRRMFAKLNVGSRAAMVAKVLAEERLDQP